MNDTTIATTDKLAITKDRVKGWEACASGYKWFLAKFPQGAQFSDVYASLQADKRYDDSGWLIDKVFAELDTAGRVQQIVLVSGANKQKIEKSVAEGANAATTGNWSNAATTGNRSNAATTGYQSNAATTGEGSNAATTGNWSNAATTGNRSNAATTGEGSNAATTGEGSNAATTGNWSNAATTGNRSNAATTGYQSNAATTGEGSNAATTGYRSNAATTGNWSIAASLGIASQAKASAGGAIVVCHRLSDGKLIAVRSAMVGQNGVKPDVWYSLDAKGKFVEVSE